MRAAYNEPPFASGGKGGFGLATYTEHYGLHQWEASDDFLRTDFNTDHQLIDAALGDKAEIVTGSYKGDGTGTRNISLGFMPRAVLLETETGERHSSTSGRRGGLALPGSPCAYNSPAYVTITTDGFQVAATNSSYGTNANLVDYYYLALK